MNQKYTKIPFCKINKNLVYLIGFTILALVPAHVSAQEGGNGKQSIKELFTQANMMLNEHLIDSALKTFLILNKMEPDNANFCYFIGQLYLETQAHKSDALPYLEKAASNITEKYLPDDPYEKKAPGMAYYYYARALHTNYRFTDAIVNFSIFKKLLHPSDARQKDIDYWINCCNNGTELMKMPVDCKITNLGDSVNSKYPDYNPVITADEQEIIFTSRRLGGNNDSASEKDENGFYNEQIWISHAKSDGNWASAKWLGNTINSPTNNADTYISPDGQQLIFFRGDTTGNLYVSNLKGTQWNNIELIDSTSPGIINSGNAMGACLSPDQKTLLFVSNRAGGFGGTDIYKITIYDNGSWSQPVNLGANINTEYDENAPFIHTDDSTLFFSSKGHNSMGGFDIFMANLDAVGNWNNVTNLGYPINTPNDDTYFSVSPDGKRAYYSSVRNDTYGEKDIYEVTFKNPLPVKKVAILVGYIRTPDKSPLPKDVILKTSLVKGGSTINIKTNPITGKFLAVLSPNRTYNVVISTQKKEVFNQNFYLSADSSYSMLSRAFFRTGIILGDTSNVLAPKPKVPLDSMTGQVLIDETPIHPLANMKIQLIDAKGNIIQTTLTDKNGHFTFVKLPMDQSYQLEVDITDPKLKHVKKLLLVNSKGEVVRTFDQNKEGSYFYHDLPANLNDLSQISELTTVQPKIIRITSEDAIYVEYFKYNSSLNTQKASSFNLLINKIKSKLLKDTVTVLIQSSASKVPTSAKYKNSNAVLADKRAEDEKRIILDALKKKQVNTRKLKFEIQTGIQGPEYEKDAQNQDKYEKFQYVKVFVH